MHACMSVSRLKSSVPGAEREVLHLGDPERPAAQGAGGAVAAAPGGAARGGLGVGLRGLGPGGEGAGGQGGELRGGNEESRSGRWR